VTGISAVATASDFFTAIRTGRIPGHSFLTVSAVNRNVGGTFETVWEQGGIYAFPPAPGPMTVSSDSLLDNGVVPNVGMQTLLLTYLDGTYTQQTEIITLNGQTPVATAAVDILRVVSLQGLTWGANNLNDGTVYIGTGPVGGGVPATVYGLISPDDNTSLHGFLTIPDGFTGYLCAVLASVAGNKGVDTSIRLRPAALTGFLNTGEVEQTGSADQFFVKGTIGYPEHSDLRFDSFVDVGTEEVTIFSEILLVSNSL
jgi:hypothetical protein